MCNLSANAMKIDVREQVVGDIRVDLVQSQGQKAGNPCAVEARVRKYPLARSPRGATGGAGTNPRYGGDGRRPTLVPP